MQKAFISSDNKATLACPECDRSRTFDVTPYLKVSKAVTIKVKCPCGNRFPVQLERRRHFRKSVHFEGTFSRTAQGRDVDRGRVAVLDLSRTGVKLRLNDNSSLGVGDTILLEFELDDSKRSRIRKESIIRRIDGFDLGAEFASTDPSDPDAKAIGFYLFT